MPSTETTTLAVEVQAGMRSARSKDAPGGEEPTISSTLLPYGKSVTTCTLTVAAPAVKLMSEGARMST